MKRIFFILAVTMVFTGYFSRSQEIIPMNQDALFFFEKNIVKDSLCSHPSIKPFIVSNDSLFSNDSNYVRFGKEKSRLAINPVINFSADFDKTSGIPFHFSYGLSLYGRLNQKLFVQGFLVDCMQRYENYMANSTVVPHFGEYYRKKSFDDVYHYLIPAGVISFAPSQHFNFMIGRQKNFLGEGYRSLFLSDNSNYSNALRGTLDIWHFKYMILYSWFRDIFTTTGTNQLHNKFTTTHYLSWNVTKWMNLNFFEAIIWPGEDSLGNRGFDVNYANPIIFFRPVEFSLGSPDNAMMGIGGTIKIKKKIHFYGQFLIDEFKIGEVRANTGWWGNKYGLQTGAKYVSEKFFARVEHNQVRPYTYSHQSSYSNYGSYCQPFAHPMGANFKEWVLQSQYNVDRWLFSAKVFLIKYGLDTSSLSYGQDIYRSYNDKVSEYGNFTTQGLLTTKNFTEIKVAYFLNKRALIGVETGLRIRNIINALNESKQVFVFFGLRTYLFNNESE
ncbi:MAG: hypothetical protein A2W91_16485 [Bacteroidetes bacterium GWF2_38_335]|nr:MAG: hypothetical protein A2W91_16485 [Bacteroidetes bacterium GWF2_38_335]OFY81286.1 MAG: hypothetical protein A2281_07460 [Bacteroidetes bacterium RIFOXYA12_FULL_38_20]HBS85405.1 hypothetical protein [Bacteroidales bacterium]